MNPDRSTVKVLIIGYGNELRGDDCAGRRVADIIADRENGNIKVLSVHQLTPDLAPLLSEADLAIFADASAEEFDDDIRVHTLSPSKPIMDGAHKSSSAELLGLAEWLYGHCPEAYGVDIAAVSFEFSLEISPRTQAAINTAVKCIDDIVSGSLENVKCMK